MKAFFTTLIIFIAFRLLSQGVPISPLIMGQSYHYTDWNSPKTASVHIFGAAGHYTNFPLTNDWPKVTESGTKLMRVSGNQYNIGPERPLGGQEVYYVSIVDDIRRNGCEPVLTLPFLLDEFNDNNYGDHLEKSYTSSEYTAAVAASIRTLQAILHLVNTVHKRNITHVILGNEPDLDYLWTTEKPESSHTLACQQALGTNSCVALSPTLIAANIAGYIKPMADAVRNMETEMGVAMKIIGPEYTHCLPEVYDLLFTPSITSSYLGGIATVTSSGSPNTPTQKPYLDFISIHAYGPEFISDPEPASYNPSFTQGTAWTPSLTFCNIERYAKDWIEPMHVARRYRGAMHYMKRLADGCTNRGNFAAMGWMVTEMNSSHTTSNTAATTASADAAGMDAISMEGAQNLARMYALAMEYGCAAVCMWSVRETASNQDRGYLSGTGTNPGSKRPSWFHYKMLGDYFSRGTYYRDEVMAAHVSSSGISINSFDGSPNSGLNSNQTNTETRGPEWLHYKSTTTQTISFPFTATTYSLKDAADFNTHLQAMCETKAFAVKGSSIAVMVVNHANSIRSVSIRFGNGNFGGQANKKFWFNIPLGGVQHDYFNGNEVPAHSTSVFIYDCSGNFVQRYTYAMAQATVYNQTYTGTVNNVTPMPVSSSTTASGNNCLGLNNVTITVSGAGTGGFTWSKLPSEQISETSNVLTVAPNHTMGPGIYQAIAPGCSSTLALATVVHQNAPLVNAGLDASFCNTTSIPLGDPNLPNNQTYAWSAYGGTQKSFALTSVPQSTTLVMTASLAGCTASDVVYIKDNNADLMIADDLKDKGQQPNQNPGSWHWGSGIWVRNQPDGLPAHQNPLSGATNYVYVRLENAGCGGVAAGAATVSLYQTKATTTPSWSTSYTTALCSALPSSTTCIGPVTGTCAGGIGTLTNGASIPGSGTQTLVFTWNTPLNRPCFSSSVKDGWWNLLAHVSSPGDLVPAQSSDVATNVVNSNNVSCKQVFVTAGSISASNDLAPDNCIFFDLAVPEQSSSTGPLIKVRNDLNNESLLDYADVYLCVSKSFGRKWDQGGATGTGAVYINDSVIQITAENAQLTNILFGSHQYFKMSLYIQGRQLCNNSGGPYFEVDFLLGGENGSGGAVKFLVPKDSIFVFSGEEGLLGSQNEEYRVAGVKGSNALAGVSLYPTPTASELTITALKGVGLANVEIIDLQGRRVFRQIFESSPDLAKITLPEMAQGTYLISIVTTDGFIWRAKFVKSE